MLMPSVAIGHIDYMRLVACTQWRIRREFWAIIRLPSWSIFLFLKFPQTLWTLDLRGSSTYTLGMCIQFIQQHFPSDIIILCTAIIIMLI